MENLRNRTYEAYYTSIHLYNKFEKRLNKEQLQELILTTLESIRFNSGSGYFFVEDITTPNTAIALVLPGMEGEDRYNAVDINGKYFIRDLIKILKKIMRVL